MKKQHLDLGDAVAHTTFIVYSTVNCSVFSSRSKFHGCQTDPKFYYWETRLVGRALLLLSKENKSICPIYVLSTGMCRPTPTFTPNRSSLQSGRFL